MCVHYRRNVSVCPWWFVFLDLISKTANRLVHTQPCTETYRESTEQPTMYKLYPESEVNSCKVFPTPSHGTKEQFGPKGTCKSCGYVFRWFVFFIVCSDKVLAKLLKCPKIGNTGVHTIFAGFTTDCTVCHAHDNMKISHPAHHWKQWTWMCE